MGWHGLGCVQSHPTTSYLQILTNIVENITACGPAKSTICISVKFSVPNSAALRIISYPILVATNWALQKLSFIASSSTGDADVTISSIQGKVSSWFTATAIDAKLQLTMATALNVFLHIVFSVYSEFLRYPVILFCQKVTTGFVKWKIYLFGKLLLFEPTWHGSIFYSKHASRVRHIELAAYYTVATNWWSCGSLEWAW